MEAVDPIDVMRIKTGYYTSLSAAECRSHPQLVVLASGGSDAVDTTSNLETLDVAASRDAYEQELLKVLQDEFRKAQVEAITCLDGQPVSASATEVSLTRTDPQRESIVCEWVDALAKLTWARGRWIAPKLS
ncbi:MAG: hypothetical protein ACR2PL_06165 [Dehalococcoidia bacterium]